MRRHRIRFSFATLSLDFLHVFVAGELLSHSSGKQWEFPWSVGHSFSSWKRTKIHFNAACGSGVGGEKLLTCMERSFQSWITHISWQVLCWVPLHKACYLVGREDGLPATMKHLEALLDCSHV